MKCRLHVVASCFAPCLPALLSLLKGRRCLLALVQEWSRRGRCMRACQLLFACGLLGEPRDFVAPVCCSGIACLSSGVLKAVLPSRFAAPGCGSLWSYKRHKAILQMLHVFVCNNWSVLMYDAHALAHRKRVVCVCGCPRKCMEYLCVSMRMYICADPKLVFAKGRPITFMKLRRKC